MSALVGDFSGKTARAVKQDFHAKVFLMTLCAAYAHPIEEKVIAEFKADKGHKHGQKINRTNALATTMDILVPIPIERISKSVMYKGQQKEAMQKNKFMHTIEGLESKNKRQKSVQFITAPDHADPLVRMFFTHAFLRGKVENVLKVTDSIPPCGTGIPRHSGGKVTPAIKNPYNFQSQSLFAL